MIEDEVIREVRAAREAFAASHGFDIRKMVAALHAVGVASGREMVCFSPRPVSTLPSESIQQNGPGFSVLPVPRSPDSPQASPR